MALSDADKNDLLHRVKAYADATRAKREQAARLLKDAAECEARGHEVEAVMAMLEKAPDPPLPAPRSAALDVHPVSHHDPEPDGA